MAAANAQLRGRVVASYFLGDRTKILLEGVSDDVVVVETAERKEFPSGTEVGLTVNADALLTLD